MSRPSRVRLSSVLVSAVLVLASCGAANDRAVDSSAGAEAPSTASSVEGEADAGERTISESSSTDLPATTTTVGSSTSAVPRSTTTVTTTSEASPAASDDPGGAESTAQPDFVNLVGGGQLDLNSIEGSDTVLWFWAPW